MNLESTKAGNLAAGEGGSSGSIFPIPPGSVPALRLVAASFLLAKQQLVQVLSSGGAVEWDARPGSVRQIGQMLQATRFLHSRCTEIADASTPAPAIPES